MPIPGDMAPNFRPMHGPDSHPGSMSLGKSTVSRSQISQTSSKRPYDEEDIATSTVPTTPGKRFKGNQDEPSTTVNDREYSERYIQPNPKEDLRGLGTHLPTNFPRPAALSIEATSKNSKACVYCSIAHKPCEGDINRPGGCNRCRARKASNPWKFECSATSTGDLADEVYPRVLKRFYEESSLKEYHRNHVNESFDHIIRYSTVRNGPMELYLAVSPFSARTTDIGIRCIYYNGNSDFTIDRADRTKLNPTQVRTLKREIVKELDVIVKDPRLLCEYEEDDSYQRRMLEVIVKFFSRLSAQKSTTSRHSVIFLERAVRLMATAYLLSHTFTTGPEDESVSKLLNCEIKARIHPLFLEELKSSLTDLDRMFTRWKFKDFGVTVCVIILLLMVMEEIEISTFLAGRVGITDLVTGQRPSFSNKDVDKILHDMQRNNKNIVNRLVLSLKIAYSIQNKRSSADVLAFLTKKEKASKSELEKKCFGLAIDAIRELLQVGRTGAIEQLNNERRTRVKPVPEMTPDEFVKEHSSRLVKQFMLSAFQA